MGGVKRSLSLRLRLFDPSFIIQFLIFILDFMLVGPNICHLHNALHNIFCLQMKVQVRGEAMVSLNEDVSAAGGTRSLASETYIDVTMDLLRGDTSSHVGTREREVDSDDVSSIVTNTRVSLPPGEYRYPISCLLPQTILSSFAGKFGSITYVVRATLTEDKRLNLGATVCSEPFLVQRVLDMSTMSPVLDKHPPQHGRTVSVTHRGYATPWFCLFGTIDASFTVDKDVYCPGDDVIIEAKITNDSSEAIEVIHTMINLNSCYGANKRLYNHTRIINMRTDTCRCVGGG